MEKMKTIMTVLSLACLSLSMNSCMKSDIDDIRKELQEHEERLTLLETWQTETNTNIQALQTLLSTTDYITEVTPVMKNDMEVGFTISFLNTPSITIYHGTNGDTPQISVTQGEDDNWYWTLNGELLTDAQDNPIKANGIDGDSAPLPQLATGTNLTDKGITTDSQNDAIVADAIYLSVDGGKTWTRVNGKDGDRFFENVDTTNDDYIIFTLADGSTFQVPRYTGVSLTFNPESVSIPYGETIKIQCTAGGSADFTTDNLFVLAPAGWKAEIALTRSASTGFTLTVTAPNEDSEGEILVMLDNKKGNTTIGRMPVKTAGGIVGTELKADGLTSGQIANLIGDRTDLTSVIMTNCVLSSQDWYAIRKNESLETIDLGESTYNSVSFYYMHSIVGNSTLQLLTVPDGVTTISERAFYDCDKLTTVTIPASVEEIWQESFKNCEAMTTFTIPADSKLTKIGREAFVRCYKLESIFIPATVKTIDNMAFNICQSLKSVTFAEGSQLTEIPYYCFGDNVALPSINLPAGVTSIREYAFRNCTSLESINIPDGVKSIGNYAFWCCKALPSITLPGELESIGKWAFATCQSLTSITLPEGVMSIGDKAFAYCDVLTTVTCLAEIPPTLGETVFYSSPALTNIYVPSASVDAYKAAWSEYADKIVAIP